MIKQKGEHYIDTRALEPYQWITISTLLLILITCGIALVFGLGDRKYFGFVCGFLALYVVAMRGGDFLKSDALRMGISSFTTVGVMWGLYSLLGVLTFKTIPYMADSWLAQIDRIIAGGQDPVVSAARFLNTRNAPFFSFVYAVFIPYLYISILMSLLGRPYLERKVFITAFAMTYAISFLGYIFVPARGPIIFLQERFLTPIPQNYFYNLIMETLQKCGGPHGAFPSLHVGAAWFACFFDLKYNRLRGLLYLPLVILIAIATVLLRFHYFIDLIAGGVIGSFSVWLAAKIILGSNKV